MWWDRIHKQRIHTKRITTCSDFFRNWMSARRGIPNYNVKMILPALLLHVFIKWKDAKSILCLYKLGVGLHTEKLIELVSRPTFVGPISL